MSGTYAGDSPGVYFKSMFFSYNMVFKVQIKLKTEVIH